MRVIVEQMKSVWKAATRAERTAIVVISTMLTGPMVLLLFATLVHAPKLLMALLGVIAFTAVVYWLVGEPKK